MSDPKDPPDKRAPAKLHDALFRRTFSDPVHMAGELRVVLSAPLIAQLDLETLKVLSGSYVDEDLRTKESDLLLSVQLAQRPALIYVLCEHQSRAGRRMPLRLLGYLVRIWERHATQHPAGALPPIVPLVVHHERKAWSAPRRLSTLFSLDPPTHALLAPYLPDFTFVLDDLAAISPAVIRARSELSALAKLVLFALQRARHSRGLAKELTAFGETLNELARAGRDSEDWGVVFGYIFRVSKVSPQQLVDALGETIDPKVREVIMTTAQRLFAEGRPEGRTEGRIEGRTEGRTEGRVDTLAKLLSIKFGALPAETHARLYAATSEELDRWTEQVLFAASLEDALR